MAAEATGDSVVSRGAPEAGKEVGVHTCTAACTAAGALPAAHLPAAHILCEPVLGCVVAGDPPLRPLICHRLDALDRRLARRGACPCLLPCLRLQVGKEKRRDMLVACLCAQ